ncbi:alpha/beta hydrolase fold protein [Trichodelitschia bisporula]|uniref:Alpha/beta hydrolase fold protein n=1 Tax=Trichodelitschia bisporula TaxID=703511 RepID=A0A6G1HWX4_9PEZI|nr:alpha/beta hydrolase fold protein [Trichodelitschia bisporula]
MAEPQEFKVETTHGTLAVSTIGSGSPAVLLIHGNSSCKKIFRHIINSSISNTHQIIAFDLPGHGDSSNAPNLEADYTQPAYADAAVQLLDKLEVKEAVVVGWSLGGHIGMEMIPIFPGLKGLVITGTPPVDLGELDLGFKFGPGGWRDAMAAKEVLSPEEIEGFAHGSADPPYEDWMKEAVVRTDGRARSIMFHGFGKGECSSQRELMKQSDVPIAVVNGADEPFVNLDWVKKIEYKNLWKGKTVELEGGLHAPFWGQPDRYVEILEEFLKDVTK